jgi:hypothetical protein
MDVKYKGSPFRFVKKRTIVRKHKKLGRHIDTVIQYNTHMKYRISKGLRGRRETRGIILVFRLLTERNMGVHLLCFC